MTKQTCHWCIRKPRKVTKVAVGQKSEMPICRECWLKNVKNPHLKFKAI